jgi:hypothetical protein
MMNLDPTYQRKIISSFLTLSLCTFLEGEKPSFLVLRTGSLLERYLLHNGVRKVGLTVSGSFSVAKPTPDAVEVQLHLPKSDKFARSSGRICFDREPYCIWIFKMICLESAFFRIGCKFIEASKILYTLAYLSE